VPQALLITAVGACRARLLVCQPQTIRSGSPFHGFGSRSSNGAAGAARSRCSLIGELHWAGRTAATRQPQSAATVARSRGWQLDPQQQQHWQRQQQQGQAKAFESGGDVEEEVVVRGIDACAV